MELVLASANLHKIREFREMLKPFDIDVLTLHQFPECHLPEETGTTFQENALIKGRYVAQQLKKMVIADDSGLVVPMLNGLPGVRSNRFSGENGSDRDNCLKLLKEMSHLTGINRSAYFECCLVLCSPDGLEKSFTGKCEGVILLEQRGRNGFGYDSLFLKHDYEKSFAELDESVKNRISHRFKAFEKLALALEGVGITKRTRR
jgi:XTP/dITP diphosphohydrolase